MTMRKTAVLALCAVLSVSACKKIDLSKPIWTPDHVKAQQQKQQKQQKATGAAATPRGLNQAYEICSSCLLLPKGQNAIRADVNNIRGQLESIHVMGDKVQFNGWAADTGTSRPVEKILIFANDRLVHEGVALGERLDVAQALGDGGTIRSGFSVVLDKALFTGLNGKDASISVYALGMNNTGAKLPFKQ